MKITDKTSKTLMVAHFFATIMIIAIHYNKRALISASGDIWGWNYMTQEVLANGLARSGVPYFALVSGFFLFSQLSETKSYFKILHGKCRTLFVPYILGAAIIYLCLTAAKLAFGNTSFIDIKTAFYGIFITPNSGQFWFLRDLCFLVVCSPLLFPKNKFLKYIFGIVLSLLWALELQIAPVIGDWYLVNMETLLFFYLGGQLSLKSNILNRLVNAKAFWIMATSLILAVVITARIIMDPTIDLWYNTRREYGLIPLLLYKATIAIGIINLIQISAIYHSRKTLIYLSGLTFFAFLFHLTPLDIAISRFTNVFIAKPFSFYVSFPMATLIVFYTAHRLSKSMPEFFRILSGNRYPRKSLGRIGQQGSAPFTDSERNDSGKE